MNQQTNVVVTQKHADELNVDTRHTLSEMTFKKNTHKDKQTKKSNFKKLAFCKKKNF